MFVDVLSGGVGCKNVLRTRISCAIMRHHRLRCSSSARACVSCCVRTKSCYASTCLGSWQLRLLMVCVTLRSYIRSFQWRWEQQKDLLSCTALRISSNYLDVTSKAKQKKRNAKLVGGLEHFFYFPIQLGIIIPVD